MKKKFDLKEHIKNHKERIAKIKKNIRERKMSKLTKEEINQNRELFATVEKE